MTKDKRKYLRFQCTLPADIIQLEPDKRFVSEAKIDEFSREGIRLVLTLNLKPGSILDLSMRLPNTEETASLSGEVIWSRGRDSSIEIGLKIKEMDARTKAEVFDFLYKHWLEAKTKEIKKSLTGKKEKPKKETE